MPRSPSLRAAGIDAPERSREGKRAEDEKNAEGIYRGHPAIDKAHEIECEEENACLDQELSEGGEIVSVG